MKGNQFRSLIAASGQAATVDSLQGEAAKGVRKPGKRTAPDYVQVGVYLPKALHNQAKVKLIHEGRDRDFSQLIGDLLNTFVAARGPAGD